MVLVDSANPAWSCAYLYDLGFDDSHVERKNTGETKMIAPFASVAQGWFGPQGGLRAALEDKLRRHYQQQDLQNTQAQLSETQRANQAREAGDTRRYDIEEARNKMQYDTQREIAADRLLDTEAQKITKELMDVDNQAKMNGGTLGMYIDDLTPRYQPRWDALFEKGKVGMPWSSFSAQMKGSTAGAYPKAQTGMENTQARTANTNIKTEYYPAEFGLKEQGVNIRGAAQQETARHNVVTEGQGAQRIAQGDARIAEQHERTKLMAQAFGLNVVKEVIDSLQWSDEFIWKTSQEVNTSDGSLAQKSQLQGELYTVQTEMNDNIEKIQNDNSYKYNLGGARARGDAQIVAITKAANSRIAEIRANIAAVGKRRRGSARTGGGGSSYKEYNSRPTIGPKTKVPKR